MWFGDLLRVVHKLFEVGKVEVRGCFTSCGTDPQPNVNDFVMYQKEIERVLFHWVACGLRSVHQSA